MDLAKIHTDSDYIFTISLKAVMLKHEQGEVDFIVVYVEFVWVQCFLDLYKELGPPAVKGLIAVEIHVRVFADLLL